MDFVAKVDGRVSKKFHAASMSTIYAQFNRYCKGRGFTEMVQTDESFGYVAWSNGTSVACLVDAR